MPKLCLGQEKAIQKSKYEEDVYINNHTVSGSTFELHIYCILDFQDTPCMATTNYIQIIYMIFIEIVPGEC